MHTVLGAADALDEPYRRFGFVPADHMRIRPPIAEWANHFQARPLAAHDDDIAGTFVYPRPFTELPT